MILVLLLGVGFAALRESTEIWDSSIFSITLGVLLISILLAIHRTEKRRAFWLGFALFGWILPGAVPDPVNRIQADHDQGVGFLDSKVPRSNRRRTQYFEYDIDGKMDLMVVKNSQPNALYRQQGERQFEDVTSAAGSKPWFSNILAGPHCRGSSGTTENFVRIGHSLFAVVAALLGGRLSRYVYTKNLKGTSGEVPAPVSMTSNSGM